MGLLDRLRGGRESSVPVRAETSAVSVYLLGGQDDLEVVGELAYQAVLWRLCGGTLGDRVRSDIVAVLVPEPTNPYDANAIAVQIDSQVVGYLSRATAQEFLPGLKHLMSARGGYIALSGVIVGGGYYDDGPGRLERMRVRGRNRRCAPHAAPLRRPEEIWRVQRNFRSCRISRAADACPGRGAA
jgi:hypothetical protein